LSDEKESIGEKTKKAFGVKVHGPKNPFRGNPFKKKGD
jgi:hypothetical protein